MGRQWDELLMNDTKGSQMGDEQYSWWWIPTLKLKAGHTQEKTFGKHPDALDLVKNVSDAEIEELNRGGHI